MTTEAKASLVRSAREQYPLSAALRALDLPRSTFYYWESDRQSYAEKYAHLRAPLEAIAAAGDRSNVAAALESEPEPLEVVYTDFTELVYADGRKKAWLMPIVDHASKLACGWAVGGRVTDRALSAWACCRETFRTFGTSAAGVIVHHDQDPVYTSYRWTSRLLLDDGARLSYALDGARDNPVMESFNGRFKVENRSLFLDCGNVAELARVVDERMEYYNRERRHSSLDYTSPMEYLDSLQSGG